MKNRLYLFGWLLLLPLLVGCNNTDDVSAIFTGKTWKLTYITVKDKHEMIPLWGNDAAARTASMQRLAQPGSFCITFMGTEKDHIITGSLSGSLITTSISGTWSANGENNQFDANASGSDSDVLAKEFMKGLNEATSYGGDDRNLYIYYAVGKQTYSLTFHVKE